jgi:hypothetical protein
MNHLLSLRHFLIAGKWYWLIGFWIKNVVYAVASALDENQRMH